MTYENNPIKNPAKKASTYRHPTVHAVMIAILSGVDKCLNLTSVVAYVVYVVFVCFILNL